MKDKSILEYHGSVLQHDCDFLELCLLKLLSFELCLYR